MSDEYIKKDDAIKALGKRPLNWMDTPEEIQEGIDWDEHITAIEALSPADVVKRKRGEWIPCTKSGLPLTEMMRREGQKWYGYKCSNCNHIYKGNALTDCNFCHNCGSDNRRGEDDESD